MLRSPVRLLLVAISIILTLACGQAQEAAPRPVPLPPSAPVETPPAQPVVPNSVAPGPTVPDPAAIPVKPATGAKNVDTAPIAPAETSEVPANPVTLEACIAGAMLKNFDLQIQDYNTSIAKDAVDIAQGAFDPNLFASASRTVNQAAAATSTLDGTTLVGPRTDNTLASVGVNELLSQTGAIVGISGNTYRDATNSRLSTLNPAFNAGLTATVSQPLLKGFGSAVNRQLLERNKVGYTIAGYNYRSRVLQVIHDTEVAYYNLVAARETLRIRRLSLGLAQTLVDENQARRTTGVATDLDVATAAVGVSNARLAVVLAEQGVRNSEDALLNLIGPTDFSVRPGAVTFGDYIEGTPSFSFSYKAALDNSPDYFATIGAVKQFQIDVDAAKQNSKPTLNVNGSLGYANTDDSYDSAVTNLPDRHGNSWSLGLTYSMPWGLRADRARYRTAMSTLNQQKARLNQFEQNLTVNVRTAVRAVETDITSVEIAADATRLSVQEYNLQKARFDAGLSTSRLVIEAQDDLETARLNELTAKVSLRTAAAALHQLEGSSIARFKVALPQ